MQTTDSERNGESARKAEAEFVLLPRPGAFTAEHAKHRARFEALASLLADDSPAVWSQVRGHFESAGRAGLPALERATRVDSPIVRLRARALILAHERRRILRRLIGYVVDAGIDREPRVHSTRGGTRGGGIDLEKALFLLARYHEPRLDPRPFQCRLDALGREVAARARLRVDAMQRARVLVEYLGIELGYGGSHREFHHPDNIHLHRVLDLRHGMPLSLCAVYMFVARRAGLHATCVPLPGQVMLRLHGAQSSMIVDPYKKGETRTERDCRAYLEKSGLPYKPAWFRDADDRTLLKRQVANLIRSAQSRGVASEERDLRSLLSVLEKRSAPSPAANES